MQRVCSVFRSSTSTAARSSSSHCRSTCQQIYLGHTALVDQLRRAALSVPLNIAEGAGRVSEADVARHYGIARGSAMECAAIVDVLRVLGALDEARHSSALDLLGRVVSMLTKLARVQGH